MKTITLQDKLFLKDRARSIFNIPLNFGSVMTKNMEKIKAAGALAPQPLMLTDERQIALASARVLKKYWSIPQRQIETSVVLAEDGFTHNKETIK